MRIRQAVMMAGVCVSQGAIAQAAVDLPGVHATAGCVEPAGAAPVGLSYACLSQRMTGDMTPMPVLDGDVTKSPTNRLGLYNASGLRNRMGTNLGRSVQPYRPVVTYPTPMATPVR